MDRASNFIKEAILILVLFQFLVLVSGTSNPLSIVVSGSMEPTLYRGDIAILYNNHKKPLEVGEIVAFSVRDDSPTILHRISHINHTDNTIITKGDNNQVSDSSFLYKGRLPMERVDSRVWMVIPYVGQPFTWLIESSPIKYTLLTLFVIRDLFFPWCSLW